MSTTAQPQATQAQVTPVAANMFTVAGGSLHVGYNTSGIDGQASPELPRAYVVT